MVLSLVEAGRRAAESLMTATWRIERETGEFAEVNYKLIPVRTVVYEGIGKLQTYEGYEQNPTTGPATTVVQRTTLHIPVTADYTSHPGDVAECISSRDPQLVGRRVRVAQKYPTKEHATAYRFFVDELIEG